MNNPERDALNEMFNFSSKVHTALFFTSNVIENTENTEDSPVLNDIEFESLMNKFSTTA